MSQRQADYLPREPVAHLRAYRNLGECLVGSTHETQALGVAGKAGTVVHRCETGQVWVKVEGHFAPVLLPVASVFEVMA